MRNMLIAGGSRGLGLAFAEGLKNQYEKIYIISRTKPSIIDDEKIFWIDLDLSNTNDLTSRIKLVVKDEIIHTLIYNAGIWEEEVFNKASSSELINIVNVNLSSPIVLINLLHDNIVRGKGNIILIGSTCGLENEGANCVAYVSSKFGIRGVAHSLREHFRKDFVRVTCLNPGSMATDFEVNKKEEALEYYNYARMPVDDLLEIVRCITRLSMATNIKEIDMPALLDTDV